MMWLVPAFIFAREEDGEDVGTNNCGHIINARHKKAKVMGKIIQEQDKGEK